MRQGLAPLPPHEKGVSVAMLELQTSDHLLRSEDAA
jgi:hypothetical protein